MDFSRWIGGGGRSASGGGRRPGSRISIGIKPACEALDERQLLSTVAVSPPGLLMPPAASVSMAASFLGSKAPSAFAQFQTALARAEQHSDLNYDNLCDALGRKAITNLGPGESQRDAIVVYYEGQINKFIK